MQAVLFDDAIDTPGADLEPCLPELLGDDVDGGVGVEEAVADDLSDEFAGTDVVAFGPSLLSHEAGASLFIIGFEQLIVSLFAEAELLGGPGGAETFALSFDEHGEALDDEVVIVDGEFAGGPGDALRGPVEQHVAVLRGENAEAAATFATMQRRIALPGGVVQSIVALQTSRRRTKAERTGKIGGLDNAINY